MKFTQKIIGIYNFLRNYNFLFPSLNVMERFTISFYLTILFSYLLSMVIADEPVRESILDFRSLENFYEKWPESKPHHDRSSHHFSFIF